MNKDYFSKVRILDGGMGQTLLEKGLKAKGSFWSATALIDKKYHQLVIDTHLDFIKSGADVIVTNNFSARRKRMIDNEVEDQFNPNGSKEVFVKLLLIIIKLRCLKWVCVKKSLGQVLMIMQTIQKLLTLVHALIYLMLLLVKK